MTLVAHLRDDALLARAEMKLAVFPERVRERLLDEDMLAVMQRVHRSGVVRVIRRADGDGVNALHLVEHLAEVGEKFRVRIFRCGLREARAIHIAKGDDFVVRRDAREVRLALAVNADACDGDLLQRALREEEIWEHAGRRDGADALNERTTGVAWISHGLVWR